VVQLLPGKDAVAARNLDLAREALVAELGAAREVGLAALATLFLVHFGGAAALFDFFLKAYFAPAEACTAIVRTAKKAALGVLS
jgi:hypothetical protein